MFKNYLKISWRSLKKNSSYTLINITGLGLGIGSGILIFTIVAYHLSFDNFHKNKNRVYRVITEVHQEGISYLNAVPQGVGPALQSDYSFGEQTARIYYLNNTQVSVDNGNGAPVVKFMEKNGVAFAEPAFFDIFNFPLVGGNEQAVLVSPHTAIITERNAQKYFGTASPIGKVIRIDNKTDFTVTGILKDLPTNTDFKTGIFLSYASLRGADSGLVNDDNWEDIYGGLECYTRLKPGIAAVQANRLLRSMSGKYYKKESANQYRFTLEPLNDIHFNMQLNGAISMKTIWSLSWIGIFLNIVACVNFINLATAQSVRRSKEVGLRKVLGGIRGQIFTQFIIETLLLTLAAAGFGYLLAYQALPYLNSMYRIGLSVNLLQHSELVGFLVLLIVLVVLISGFYPGWILSGYNPARAIKENLSSGSTKGISLRKSLVAVQFIIVQALIIAVIVVAGQMSYATHADMGFTKKGIVLLSIPQRDKSRMNTLRDRLLQLPGVEKVSLSFAAPAANFANESDFFFNNRPKRELFSLNMKYADDQYLQTYGLKLVTGRNIFPSDTVKECLVNETFVRKMHLQAAEDVIGKTIWTDEFGSDARVVGVMKDFNNFSFRSAIPAVCVLSNTRYYQTAAVRFNMTNTRQEVSAFQRLWSETYPENVFSYHFLDEDIAGMYKKESIQLDLIGIFTVIAILIGCMGLYGLVSFMAMQKTKEIAVRKVLGASTPKILWLFGKEFSILLLVSFVIAGPVAALAMYKWLQDYAYRISMNAGIFALSFFVTAVVVLFTVGVKSVAAALANPIKSLRGSR